MRCNSDFFFWTAKMHLSPKSAQTLAGPYRPHENPSPTAASLRAGSFSLLNDVQRFHFWKLRPFP
jgi:hypothetical protein